VIKKVSIALAGLVMLGYASAVGLLYAMQGPLLYRAGENYVAPDIFGLAGVREVEIKTADHETLKAWYTPAKTDRATIIFCHGSVGTSMRRRVTGSYSSIIAGLAAVQVHRRKKACAAMRSPPMTGSRLKVFSLLIS
jgi:hypothetical protein